MSKYKILVVGRGKRGMHHATTFNANPKFQVTGICNVDMVRLDAAAAKLGNPEKGTDATALARKLKPDVFCFCTLPNLRIPMIKAALESHQNRYGRHYQKVKEIIAGGALGRVHTVYGSATGWMTHMLSHLIDYTCWFNNYTPAT